MVALLGWYAILGFLGLAGARRLGHRGLRVAVLGPLASLVWLVSRLPDIVDHRVVSRRVEWLPALGLNLDLRLDGFAALMVLLVSGVGVLVFLYGVRYFPADHPDIGRLAALLTLFAGSMVGLVLTDNLLVLYGFWELTSITSFLLIGNDHRSGRARAAALQALLVTSTGALAMLVGFVVLGQRAGSYRISAIVADPPSGSAVTVAVVLILLGAFTKSAQYPFHNWLPGAMAAPTPVSAYLHSATMVKAGVYLVARLSPAFGELGVWRPLVLTVGLVTMIAAGARALVQHDLKVLLAMGTVSQLGFMMAVAGLGTPHAAEAVCVLLLAHGVFKAAVFMVVGVLDHEHGTRDLRFLPRPGPGWGLTVAVTVIASASMAGLPPLFGFVAKEAVFTAFDDHPGAGAAVALAAAVVGSVLTVAYSVRFALGALGLLAAPAGAARPAPPAGHAGHAPARSFIAPAVLLAAVTVAAGLVPGVLDGFTEAAARSLDTGVAHVHLALWHGVNLPLLASVAAVVGGLAVAAARRHVEPVLQRVQPGAGASNPAYRGALRGLNALANRVTHIAQPGALHTYLGVILVTAAAVPGLLYVAGGAWPASPDWIGHWTYVPMVAVVVAAAFAAAIVHRRFTAALFLGVVGYAMSGVYVLLGAPDLALTQVAIETLTTVLFVLVLRRLPDRFETRTPVGTKVLRFAVAGSIGLTVFVLAIATGAEHPETPASAAYIEKAVPDGGGKNVVNVILVDFRGFDTMGEITVLTAAAIGTVALARAHRSRDAEPDARLPPPVFVARLVTLDVSLRLVFTSVMVGSIYLLFAGHNQPGGGFAGGIVAGAAVALRYISGGIREVRRLSRGQPWRVLGSGVLIAALTAIAPLLVGGAVLEGGSWKISPPVLGDIKVTSALAFDIGVYLVVVGLTMMVFESFGDDPDPIDRRTARIGAR